jgi:hypothetical protein
MKLIQTLTLLALTYSGFSQIDNSTEKINFSKDNYKIQYPKSWSLDTSRVMGTEFFVLSPLENDSDKIRENVGLIIQNLAGQNIDLEKYKKITDGQITEIATDGKVFESVVLKSDKGEYYKITYAMTQGKFRLKITSFCYIKNDKAYVVTFTSEFDKYDHYEKTGEEILNSFLLTK